MAHDDDLDLIAALEMVHLWASREVRRKQQRQQMPEDVKAWIRRALEIVEEHMAELKKARKGPTIKPRA
jgi:hypothetical protein